MLSQHLIIPCNIPTHAMSNKYEFAGHDHILPPSSSASYCSAPSRRPLSNHLRDSRWSYRNGLHERLISLPQAKPPPTPSLLKPFYLCDTRILATYGSVSCSFLSSSLHPTCRDNTVLSFSGIISTMLVSFTHVNLGTDGPSLLYGWPFQVYVVYMGSKGSRSSDDILKQSHQMLTAVHGGR